MRHTIKICVSEKCCGRGSARVADALEQIRDETIAVERTQHCMGYCGMGPNVAVDGNILHDLRPNDAVERVRKEIDHPSPKKHGVGEKTLDDLDSILDEWI